MSTVGFNPNTQRPIRARRNFNVLAGGYRNPLYTMRASTSGVAGQALIYHTVEGQVDICVTAQTLKQELAGWLLDDVQDLSALNGYRNISDTTANFGDNTGIQQGAFVALTRTYTGTVARGNYVETTATGYIAATALTGSGLRNAVTSGVIVGGIEAVSTNDLNPTQGVEPTQSDRTLPSNQNYIRVRYL